MSLCDRIPIPVNAYPKEEEELGATWSLIIIIMIISPNPVLLGCMRVSVRGLSVHRGATSTIRRQLLQTSPLCPNDGMSIRCHKLFLSPPLSLATFPSFTPPLSPPFFPPSQTLGPSGCLLIYKCLCVLKCGTKGTGL